MNFVIAVRGAQSEKIVNGKRKRIVPFVGADRAGEFAQLGIGLMFPDEKAGMFWGLLCPNDLIHSWRGMKILEQLPCVDNSTLSACWAVAGRIIHDSDKSRLSELAKLVGGLDKIQVIRKKALVSVPSARKLNAMIINLRKKSVGVSSYELRDEVKAGRIATSPLIETLLREDEGEIQAIKGEEAEIKKPLPPEESLGVFFKDLGIANFLSGPPGDYDHTKLEELDRTAKHYSFSKYFPQGHDLRHSTKGEEPFVAPSGPPPRLNEYEALYGKIEEPWFVGVDDTKYTFTHAKFHKDRFLIKTLIERRGEVPIRGRYTIAKLRSMIGPLPAKPKARRKLQEKVAALFQ